MKAKIASKAAIVELEHLKNAFIYNQGYKIPIENTQMHTNSYIVNE
jgi:hypothetical protein